MKVLHIFKSEPDEMVKEFTEAFTDEEVETVPLYEGDVDWAKIVDQIFASDKVISWW